jgi:CheY-like chemotaxis protein
MTSNRQHPHTPNAGQHQARPTVLLLDDNMLTLHYIGLLLRPQFTVVACATVDEACAAVRRLRIDLFVSDYHLGSDSTGSTALSRLSADPAFNPLACVLVTSDPSFEVERDALAAGFSQVFHKPLGTHFKMQCAAWGEVWQRSARG